MTKYLVTGEQLRYAINSAISALDINPQDDNYIIKSTISVANNVLDSLRVSRIAELPASKIAELPASKIAETKPNENAKQDAGRETDTIDYPVVDLGVIKAADLVDIICRAYHNGLAE